MNRNSYRCHLLIENYALSIFLHCNSHKSIPLKHSYQINFLFYFTFCSGAFIISTLYSDTQWNSWQYFPSVPICKCVIYNECNQYLPLKFTFMIDWAVLNYWFMLCQANVMLCIFIRLYICINAMKDQFLK